MFGKLLKATVGVIIETPVSIVADCVDLGGSISGLDEPRTVTALKKVGKNISDATTGE